MSLEQINIPFPKYFIDLVEAELKIHLGREVDIDDISGYIFILASSGYLSGKVMK